jgi:O-methyltransferase involved in polyketide biosynthesis
VEKVHFTEEKATNLGTLYGRALDSRRSDPILGDTAADEAVRRIDYDFRRLGVNENTAVSVAIRANAIDKLARAWLAEHPDAIVLHLGCGMDTRVFRLDPPPTVEWFDVDYPEVVDVRSRLFPDRPGYTMIGSSVTDFEWLDQVPGDREALIVAEGLTMYLTAQSGGELIRRLVGKFPSGRIVADFFSSLGIKAQLVNPVVRRSGATLHWGIDDPHELARYGARVVSCLDATDWAGETELAKLPVASRLALRATGWLPVLRKMGRIGEWEF